MLVLPERTLERMLLPLVGLAAGSRLGGAFSHMLPEAVEALGDDLPELASQTSTRDKVETTAAFGFGLGILLAATRLG